jgi:hypothetical protein
MKTTHMGMVSMALLSTAIPLALMHCGDSNATVRSDGGVTGNSSSGSGDTTGTGGTGADADTGVANGSSGSGSTTVSGAGDAGVVGEAGSGNPGDGGAGSAGKVSAICQAPEGGAACDPGAVPCGSTMCDTSQTSCCHVTGDAGSDTCVGPNGACTGSLVRCNETSDCEKGLVCCDSYGVTTCAASCGPYGSQICLSDTECGLQSDAGGAKKCIVQTCGGPAPGGGPPTPVVTVEACAVQSYGGQNMPSTWGPIYGCTAK